MTPEQLARLRTYYRSLVGQRRVLENASSGSHIIRQAAFRVLEEELNGIEKDFPGLIPPFRWTDHYSHDGNRNEKLYHASSVLGFIEVAIARIEDCVSESQSTPVTESREFRFVIDPDLRKILDRDYAEAQRAYIAECWKSVILLSGGAIEAILLDLLQSDPSKARGSARAPKEPNIDRWALADLIAVAADIWPKLAAVEKLSHSVREYRNLIHPGNEIRTKLNFGREEARIALEVLNLIHRELS